MIMNEDNSLSPRQSQNPSPSNNQENKKTELDFQDDTVQALLAKARVEAEKRARLTEQTGGVMSDVPPGVRKELSSGLAGGLSSKPEETVPPEEHPAITPEWQSPLKTLRTFQGDVAETLKNQDASVISIAMAERRREKERPTITQTPQQKQREKKNTWLAIGSGFLLVVGLSILGGLYYVHVQNLPIPVAEAPETIISYDTETEILYQGLTRERFLSLIYDIKNKAGGSSGQISYLHIIKRDTTPEGAIPQTVSGQDFLSLLKTKAPTSLTRSLNNKFMLGIYKDGPSEIFILLGLSSYENAFDAMLKWEAFLWKDLGALMSSSVVSIISAPNVSVSTTTATTTEGIKASASPIGTTTLVAPDPNKVSTTTLVSSESSVKEFFVDKVVSNKDARVLLNQLGETILVYGFVTKEMLLIAPSEETFKVILDRAFAAEAR